MKLFDVGVLFENRTHHLPLHADPFPMDDPYFPEAFLKGLVQVLLHDDLHLTRLEWV